ncbi:hypothetical protein HY732_00155 [Candidatus Uhrbacteria bacterium]|nr:hypothetical protein [Candidatus Uhrbacteria bacterium]
MNERKFSYMSLGTITPAQIDHFLEVEDSLEHLRKMGSVWMSPDIAIEKPTIINPDGHYGGVHVVLSKKDLPPGLPITRGALGSLKISVRSFFAQVGIDIVPDSISLTDEMLNDLGTGGKTPIPVDIVNHGQRAVELDGNIMRFFWVDGLKGLRGPELLRTIQSGEFTVDGVEGEDWFLGGYEQDDKIANPDKGLCVVVRLKPQKYYAPYAPEPIKKNNTLKTRDDLADILKPIPPGVRLSFEISETPRIKVGDGIVAVINTGVEEQGQRHISSPLIDSGSDWPIRTETLEGMNNVEFFLYRK